ncbi:glycosyltransferase [Paenibacillus soyae]|uniref:Glycosyltransferase n=1 Tax=Paenibacillus soyae TaxID=2969249 RepID=A0A9X2MKY1_9BACL|nr:glycosyltransferase [Paenibacillus soyae]MCR2802509.1 glycosyltransferase [Paenibacillus soyae]
MTKLLISSFDMEVGGVERSLAGMLNQFDYDNHQVDLLLYRHQGDFMGLLPDRANLLAEVAQYATFRYSIAETFRSKHYGIGVTRLLSKIISGIYGKLRSISEIGYIQQQFMWKLALPFLPKLNLEYDVAISYLWPHYFVAEKVKAKRKIAWIHTDYSTVDTDIKMDLRMWQSFDTIIAVSDACRDAFLAKYGSLADRVKVVENIVSPESIQSQASTAEMVNPMRTDSRFKLLTVARLSHAKGIDQAVLALKTLRERGYGRIAWYVVGYGGDEAEIRRLIAEHNLTDHFILLGKQTNPYPFMEACDLYVQPSRYEGKAVTVTEAQILGKPVLITNYTTAASQVNHGVDGYIAELSVEGLADGIEELYSNDAVRHGLAQYCGAHSFHNRDELRKLYELMGSKRKEYAS